MQDIEEVKNKINKIIRIYEVEVAKRKIKQLLNEYECIGTNVCILGARGAGKSTFVNNVFGRMVAKTGVRQTTGKPTAYRHPDNDRIVFWDLPGYGDDRYPQTDEYVRVMKIKSYDIILFLYSNNLQKDDMDVFRMISDFGKPLFVVRTRFDVDTQDGRERLVRQQILSDLCVKRVGGGGEHKRCYFISNRSHGFDYNTLMQHLSDETQKLQAHAFSRTLKIANRDLLTTKKEALKQRIWAAAVVGASVGAIPVPGSGLLVNTAMLLRETLFMAHVLGVKEFIENSPDFPHYRKHVTEKGLVGTLQNNAMVSVKLFASDVISLLPGVGSVLSSVWDYDIAMTTLSKVLEDFLEVAEFMMGLEERECLPDDF